jgi:hypothetical protein
MKHFRPIVRTLISMKDAHENIINHVESIAPAVDSQCRVPSETGDALTVLIDVYTS